MSSFISDDRGVTEPYTDLPAIGLVSIGIVLFGYLMMSAYFSCSSSAYYAAEKDDLRAIALLVAADPSITADGFNGLLDARKMNNPAALTNLSQRCGRPGCLVYIEIRAGDHCWAGGGTGKGRSASYRLPVCVFLNDACTVRGSLTITCREG